MKVPFNINLSGKTAIVTGGSGTLCSAMAYGLAVSGANVAIIGRNIEKLASVSEKLTKNALDEYNKDVTIKGYSCNVINKDELTAAYETIKNELGSCDILINGAGGNQPGAITSIEMLKKDKEDSDYSFWNLDEDRIRDVMDLNYMGTLLPIQVFTKDMVEKRSGSIINIASVTSILPLTKVMAYGNAKSAILNLTQWLAVHFGESGIRCNAIAPGFYAAEQNHDLLFNADGTYTDRARKIITGTPIGRFGNPEELIGAALFLASDETASFVNGIVLPVDGGYSAYSGV
jgi:NAD(P)-dependent dehydrogenase (short-subunit alcohol dehydrogenase family)